MKPLEYSNVYVIESLRPGDRETGTQLFHDTISPRMKQKGLDTQCQLMIVSSKKDFFDSFDTIKNQIIYGLVNPIIHLEMHGSKDGLQVSNYEIITWKELQSRLIEMNILCGNNLFVSMATCFGGYIYSAISPRLRTPFWGFIGPFETVEESEVLANYSAFYDEFLHSDDFYAAEKALQNANSGLQTKFRLQNTEVIFEKAFRNYEETYLTSAMVEHRANSLIAQYRNLPDFKNLSTEELRKMIEDIIVKNKDSSKNTLMSHFFMWDLFPPHK